MEPSTEVAVQCGQGGLGSTLFSLVIALFMIVVMWKVFVKAKQPGWGCLIPFYNLYLILKIAGKPGWWLILFFIPIIGFIISIMVTISFAKAFNKGVGFTVGLILLPIVFFPILAFGSAVYQGIAPPVPAQ